MMPPPPENWGGRSAATAPTSRPGTTPVYEPSTGYQPSVPPVYSSVIPPYTPPRKRSPVGWILAFVGMGLFVLVVVAVMMVARIDHRNNGGADSTPTASRQGEKPFDESTADTVVTTGNDTTLTKTFVLGDEPRLSFKNVNGNITVTAWDKPTAAVSVIKRSGPDRNAQVLFTNSGGNLSIRTTQTRGNQDVRFEVKVPRELARIELSSTNGVIKVSDVTGEILIDGTNGAIELTNVAGVSKIHTTNGTIKATLLEASDRSMEFESTNGSIDVTVPPGFEADLDASTVHGSINLDETFGVTVEKGIASQKAKGEIGDGGERLRLSTTNGNIKLTTGEPLAKEDAKERSKEAAEAAKGNAKGKGNGN